jgi:protein gp37
MRRHAEWGDDKPRVFASEAYWKQPLAWDRKAAKDGVRRRVFSMSMGDLFEGDNHPDAHQIIAARGRLFDLIEQTPDLDWLLLTKRVERMARFAAAVPPWASRPAWPSNAWAGVTVEDQATADERIPLLLQVPARVRFLSMEPLLGPVDLGYHLGPMCPGDGTWKGAEHQPIRWVIVGGESGPRARPMHPDWVRSIRNQCQSAGTPFFFKSWGEWSPDQPRHEEDWDRWYFETYNPTYGNDCRASWRVGRAVAGRVLDGRTWEDVPHE